MSDRTAEEETAIKLVRQWLSDNQELFFATVEGETLADILSEIYSQGVDRGSLASGGGERV